MEGKSLSDSYVVISDDEHARAQTLIDISGGVIWQG